jgi:dihydropteroate synthase
VSATVERERVVPVIRALAADGRAAVSVDTSKAEVAASALDAGATVVNDVRAGDHRCAPLAPRRGARRRTRAHAHARHARGHAARSELPGRDARVSRVLRERAAVAWQAGIDPSRIALDPGLGFGKRLEHNLELLRALPELRSLGFPWSWVSRARASSARSRAERRADHREHETSAALALAAHLGAECASRARRGSGARGAGRRRRARARSRGASGTTGRNRELGPCATSPGASRS